MASVFTNCLLKIAGRGDVTVGPPPPDCCGGFGGGNDDDDDRGDVTYPGECPYKACLQAGAGCITIPISRDEIINQCPGLIDASEYNNPDACPYLATNTGDCESGGLPSTDAGANCVAALVGLQGQQLFSDANACESCCGNINCNGWACSFPNQPCGQHACDLESVPYDIPKCGAVQSNCYNDCADFWDQNGPQEAGGLWRSNAKCKNQGGPGGGKCCGDPPVVAPPGDDRDKLCPVYLCEIPGTPCFLATISLKLLQTAGWGGSDCPTSDPNGSGEVIPGVYVDKGKCDDFCTDPGGGGGGGGPVVPGTPNQRLCRLYKCVGNHDCDPEYKTALDWAVLFNLNNPQQATCTLINQVADQYGYYTTKGQCLNNCPCDAFRCDGADCIPAQFNPNNIDCPVGNAFVVNNGVTYYGNPSCNDQCEDICTGYQCKESLGSCLPVNFPLSDAQTTVSDCDSLPAKFNLNGTLTFKNQTACDLFCEGTDPTTTTGDSGTYCPVYRCTNQGSPCDLYNLNILNIPGTHQTCDTIPNSFFSQGLVYYKNKNICDDFCLTPGIDPGDFDNGGGTNLEDYCNIFLCQDKICNGVFVYAGNLGVTNCDNIVNGQEALGTNIYKTQAQCEIACKDRIGGASEVDFGLDDFNCPMFVCQSPIGCVLTQLTSAYFPDAQSCADFPNVAQVGGATFYKDKLQCDVVCPTDAGDGVTVDFLTCPLYECDNSTGNCIGQNVILNSNQYTSCDTLPATLVIDSKLFYSDPQLCDQLCNITNPINPPPTQTGSGGVLDEFCDLYRCVGAVCIGTSKTPLELGIVSCSYINDALGGQIFYQGAKYYTNANCDGNCINPSTDVGPGDDLGEVCQIYACVDGIDCEPFNRLLQSINGGIYNTCSEIPPTVDSNGQTFYKTRQRCNNSTGCGNVSVTGVNAPDDVAPGVGQPTCDLYRCAGGSCDLLSISLGDLNDQGANLTSCLSPQSRKTVSYNGEKLYWSQQRCIIKCFNVTSDDATDLFVFDIGDGQVIDDAQGPIYCDVFSCPGTNGQSCVQTQLRLSEVNQATGSNYSQCPPETSNMMFAYDNSPYFFNPQRCNILCTDFYDSDPGRTVPKTDVISGADEPDLGSESCEVWRCLGTGLPCVKFYVYLNSIPFDTCPQTGSFSYSAPGTTTDLIYFAKQAACNSYCSNVNVDGSQFDFGGGQAGGATGVDLGDTGGDIISGDGTSITFDGKQTDDATVYFTFNPDGTRVRREYAFTDREAVFDPVVSNRKYKDPQSKVFLPTSRGDLPEDLFADTVHLYIKSVHEMNQGKLEFSDLPYGSLPLINIERSLNSNIRSLLNNARYPDGSDLKKEILIYIRELIITNRLDKAGSDLIIRLLEECQRDEDLPSRISSTGNEADAINFAVNTGLELDFKKYANDDEKEQMRLWKVIAPDVNKRLEVITTDGTIVDVSVSSDDSIKLYEADRTEHITYITDGDQYPTSAATFEIASDKDRALINNYDDISKIMYKLNEPYEVRMTVNSAEVRLVEETYDASTARSDVYIMKMIPETLEDQPRRSALVRHTKATFELMEDEETINEWVKHKPFPYMQFYVDHEDPLFDHIEAKKQAILEFEDFSLDAFQGYERLPIFPRRIPWHIGIIPTDRDDLMFGRSRSYQTKFNEREIVFKLNPKPSEHKTSLAHPLLERATGYSIGSVKDIPTNEQSAYRFKSDNVRQAIHPYKTDEEPLPRRELPGKKLFKILSDLQQEGTEFVNKKGDTVSWGSIYKSLTPFERKALLLTEFKNWEDVKSKLFLGKFAENPTVASRYPKVSEVPKLDIDDIRDYVLPTISVKRLDIDPEAEEPEPIP